MNARTFDAIVENQIAFIRQVLNSKADEYAAETDRLHNFKVSAGITRETPAEVCIGFMAKHLTSIIDIVEDVARGRMDRVRLLDEKVGDCINYLILCKAILIEAADEKERVSEAAATVAAALKATATPPSPQPPPSAEESGLFTQPGGRTLAVDLEPLPLDLSATAIADMGIFPEAA